MKSGLALLVFVLVWVVTLGMLYAILNPPRILFESLLLTLGVAQ